MTTTTKTQPKRAPRPPIAPADAEAFLQLLEANRDTLYRQARRHVWDQNAAEDVLQEAIFEGLRSFHRFERGTNFGGWMMRILTRTVWAANRKHGRRLEAETPVEATDLEALATNQVTEETPVDERAAGRGTEGEVAVERFLEETSDEVVAALDELTPTQRRAFLLRGAHERSYREIAEELGIPVGTVMSHLARARRKLRERLHELATDLGLAGGPRLALATAGPASEPEVARPGQSDDRARAARIGA